MTRGEWLQQHNIFLSRVDHEKEADPEWIRAMMMLLSKFDEIREEEEK